MYAGCCGDELVSKSHSESLRLKGKNKWSLRVIKWRLGVINTVIINIIICLIIHRNGNHAVRKVWLAHLKFNTKYFTLKLIRLRFYLNFGTRAGWDNNTLKLRSFFLVDLSSYILSLISVTI